MASNVAVPPEFSYVDHYDRTIAFQRYFIDITGSVTAAYMLSQLMYWCKVQGWDTWIFKTRDQWTYELGLTRSEQETARKALRERGLIEESRKGIPARLHFRVNKSALNTAFYTLFTSKSKSSEKPPSGEVSPLEPQSAANLPTGGDAAEGMQLSLLEPQLAGNLPTGGDIELSPLESQLAGNLPTSKREPCQQYGGKPAISMAGILPTLDRRLLRRLQIQKPPTPTPPCEGGGLSKADQVARDCHWSDPKLLPVIDRALKRAAQNPSTAIDAPALMVENWKLFQECGPFLRFVWSPRNWIKQGHWVNSETWPVDWEAMRRERSARVGMR